MEHPMLNLVVDHFGGGMFSVMFMISEAFLDVSLARGVLFYFGKIYGTQIVCCAISFLGSSRLL
jgi:hypothetical protein